MVKLLFSSKKGIPLADYDIASGCLAQYFKKEWIGAIDEAHPEALGRHMGEAVWKCEGNH